MVESPFEKIVIVTKETQLEQLIKKFNTKSQARFYLKQSKRAYTAHSATLKKKNQGQIQTSSMDEEIEMEAQKAEDDFNELESQDSRYRESLQAIKGMVPKEVKVQHIDWSFLPNFLFGEKDLVIALGQDGLVINIAKYLHNQPIVAVNPDPAKFDGILLPFTMDTFSKHIYSILNGDFDLSDISIARASLDNGQELIGVNDIFIGPRSHTSFRCTLQFSGKEEQQSSSGIIVSTGCGSTGWLKSIVTGAKNITSGFYQTEIEGDTERAPWDAEYLYFSVREPFISKTSRAGISFGKITPDSPLVITSQTAQRGIIFSDGIENDYLEFNSGRIATISLADRKARLVTL